MYFLSYYAYFLALPSLPTENQTIIALRLNEISFGLNSWMMAEKGQMLFGRIRLKVLFNHSLFINLAPPPSYLSVAFQNLKDTSLGVCVWGVGSLSGNMCVFWYVNV